MTPQKVADAIRCLTYNYYTAILGSSAMGANAALQRMKRLQPGDLAVEINSYHKLPALEAVGYYLRSDYEDLELSDKELKSYHVQFIELLDGREYKWCNGLFIAAPLWLDARDMFGSQVERLI